MVSRCKCLSCRCARYALGSPPQLTCGVADGTPERRRLITRGRSRPRWPAVAEMAADLAPDHGLGRSEPLTDCQARQVTLLPLPDSPVILREAHRHVHAHAALNSISVAQKVFWTLGQRSGGRLGRSTCSVRTRLNWEPVESHGGTCTFIGAPPWGAQGLQGM